MPFSCHSSCCRRCQVGRQSLKTSSRKRSELLLHSDLLVLENSWRRGWRVTCSLISPWLLPRTSRTEQGLHSTHTPCIIKAIGLCFFQAVINNIPTPSCALHHLTKTQLLAPSSSEPRTRAGLNHWTNMTGFLSTHPGQCKRLGAHAHRCKRLFP